MRRIFLGVLLLVISGWGFAGISYEAVVDAGSTGSRLTVFKIDGDVLTPVFSTKIKPGISSYASNPKMLKDNLLVPMLEKVKKYFSDNGINSETVPLRFYATAGMRLVADDDQAAIYAEIKKVIPALLTFQSIDAKTITGEKEGLYLWLATNYKLKTFQNKKPTVAVLDLGGASSQIAYASLGTLPGHDKNFAKVTVNGKTYDVFSQSILGLGQQETWNTLLNFFGSSASVCVPRNYHSSLIGTSQAFSWQSCRSLINQFVDEREKSFKIRNGYPSLSRPNFAVSFPTIIATSTYTYTFNFFNAHTLNDLQNKAKSECQQSWEQLSNAHPNDPKRYVVRYCFSAAYIQSLLEKIYRLYPGDYLKPSDNKIEWVLGIVLFEQFSKSS